MKWKNPKVKTIQDDLCVSSKAAKAVKWLMNNYKELPYTFDIYGNLQDDLGNAVKGKLSPFESILKDTYRGPTNIPKGTKEEALRMIDKLIETHGVETIHFKNGDGDTISMDYCNAGCSYAATVYYSTADNAFCIGSWGDCVEFYQAEGYHAVESYEVY